MYEPPPHSAEVKERVRLYLYAPYWALTACSGWTLPSTLTPLTRQPLSLRPPRYWAFEVTLRHTTLRSIPLHEWSECRRHLYSMTHNTHMRQTTMSPVGEVEIYFYLYEYKCSCKHRYVKSTVDVDNYWGRSLSVPMRTNAFRRKLYAPQSDAKSQEPCSFSEVPNWLLSNILWVQEEGAQICVSLKPKLRTHLKRGLRFLCSTPPTYELLVITIK
jgi:hypothetical protein